MKTFLLFALTLLASALLPTTRAQQTPKVTWAFNEKNGQATISVNDKVWLESGDIWYHSNKQYYSVANGTLLLDRHVETKGVDRLGHYVSECFDWTPTDGASATFQTCYRDYLATRSYMVFSQKFLVGSDSTSMGNVDSVLSSFPTFTPSDSEASLGAFQYGEVFDGSKAYVWSGKGAKLDAYRGRAAGPLILYDSEAPTTVSVLSPFSQFMSTSLAAVHGAMSVGIVGSIESVPVDFISESILTFSGSGVTQAVIEWGDVLLNQYNKIRSDAWTDSTTRYLGYNTDHGAYYYYYTAPNMTYEQTLVEVMEYAKSANIPYHAMLLDSWWYFKGADDGVKNWTAMPSIFPSGLDKFNQDTKIPYIAHNRWWARENDYARQNGGDYDWIIQGNFSLPLEQRFWNDLIANSTQWNLRVYEQDWLCTVYDNLPAIQTDINLGRAWLRQMGSGAERSGVGIQYCMPYPRHLLQSVEIPAVVQIRASNDNTPGFVDNLIIGESDLLAYALGLAPFKDVFWTTSEQSDNPYNSREPSPALNAAVATFSTGPVMPGDKIGSTNVTLLSRSYRADGLILKPDRPAFSLDVWYYQKNYGKGPDARQITHSVSDHGIGMDWHYVLVMEESHRYQLSFQDLNIRGGVSQYLAYSWHNGANQFGDLRVFDATLTLEPNQAEDNFTVWTLAPILSPGFAVLGETNKWVSMSKQRFTNIDVTATLVTLTLTGDENEAVSVQYAVSDSTGKYWKVVDAQVVIGADGTGLITIPVPQSSRKLSKVTAQRA